MFIYRERPAFWALDNHRVADPVHFRPDPPNQNFFKPNPDPTCTHQESIKTSKFLFVSIRFLQILSFMFSIVPEKWKNSQENV